MTCEFIEEVKVFNGPNKYVDFPAAVSVVKISRDENGVSGAIDTLRQLEQSDLRFDERSAPKIKNSFDLLCVVTQAFLNATPESALEIRPGRLGENTFFLAIPYYEPNAAIISLKSSLGLCNDVLRIARMKAVAPVEASAQLSSTIKSLQQAIEYTQSFNPRFDECVLINAARERGIPTRLIASQTLTWQFGNGRLRHLFFGGTSTELDSAGGARLSANKFATSTTISSLGFPTPRGALVQNIQGARSVASSLGYPIVVKPNNLSQGGGVTANIDNVVDLDAAFGRAVSASSSLRDNFMQMHNIVLVEEHVKGDDFRLVVAGGKFQWAVCRRPAQIIGDGKRKIWQLIADENLRRNQIQSLRETSSDIVIDEDLKINLKRSGLSVDSVLPKKAVALLRSAANVSLGGTIDDVTSLVDPQNIAMAEAIARAFHLDTSGIDFIASDISIPWYEQKCAIIEINAGPQMAAGDYARKVIAAKFPQGGNGRIPIVVVVGSQEATLALINERLQNRFTQVGCVSSSMFELGGIKRSKSILQPIVARVHALLADPQCGALLISLEPGYLEETGFPVDFCSLTLLGEKTILTDVSSRIVESGSERVIKMAESSADPSFEYLDEL